MWFFFARGHLLSTTQEMISLKKLKLKEKFLNKIKDIAYWKPDRRKIKSKVSSKEALLAF